MKSYQEKLHNDTNLPQIITLNEFESKKWGGKTMVIAKPMDVYECICSIEPGRLATSKQIRDYLARFYDVDSACPVTTNIFINISAHAAVEGFKSKMPFWRVLQCNGMLNYNFPNAPHEQIKKLASEGFDIEIRGGKYFVRDYQRFLYRL